MQYNIGIGISKILVVYSLLLRGLLQEYMSGHIRNLFAKCHPMVRVRVVVSGRRSALLFSLFIV